MKLIQLRGGGKVHIVRGENVRRDGIATAVVMECGKVSGQLASVFDGNPNTNDLCYWCVVTLNADRRARAAAGAEQLG